MLYNVASRMKACNILKYVLFNRMCFFVKLLRLISSVSGFCLSCLFNLLLQAADSGELYVTVNSCLLKLRSFYATNVVM